MIPGAGSVMRVAVPDIEGELSHMHDSRILLYEVADHPMEVEVCVSAGSSHYMYLHRLLERDQHAGHCVQYTVHHLSALVRSVFDHPPVLLEYTATNGSWIRLLDSYPVTGNDSTHLWDNGYIQRCSVGSKNQSRSIVIDVYR